MTDIQKLKALAEAATPGPWGADNSHHVGSINAADRHIGMASMYARRPNDITQNLANQDFIAAANPAAVLELITEIERLSERMKIVDFVHGPKAEMHWNQLKAENEALRKDAVRWQFIRDVWPKVKLVPNGDWFNSCFLEREIDAAMSKEASHD